MTAADFDDITHDRALCDAEGAIDAAGFEAMMREQVPTRASGVLDTARASQTSA
jgi:hypothetical protein